MNDYHGAVDTRELDQLLATWGMVPRRHVELPVDHPFLSGHQQRLVSDGRRAEICYVMHRGTPTDGVLLHIKSVYPDGAYRLPTGGVHLGETVTATLAREITEETGLDVGEGTDQVRVQRFLGVLSYNLVHASLGSKPFATYFFLVKMPRNGRLAPQDPAEQIAGWRWCPSLDLGRVAHDLETVGVQAPHWADWGRYRAQAHHFMAQILGL